MKLSEKIKLLRTSGNLTQPELAAKAGIEQSYLSKLENDKGSPSFDVINKIAQVFGLSGLDLINSLSQTYIEQNLAHIPEVAAEFASIKKIQHKQLKNRFIMSSLVVVIGVGLFFMGMKAIFFSEMAYIYESAGVIKQGETMYQFEIRNIKEINETDEEAEARINSNRTRFDLVYLTVAEYLGHTYIKSVEGGRRLYNLREEKKLDSTPNDVVSTLGMMLIVSGIFMFVYSFRFRSI